MGKGPLALAYLFAGRTSRSEHSHATRFTIVDVNHLAAVGQQISRCGRTNSRVEVTGCCGEQVFQILISITGILRASELPHSRSRKSGLVWTPTNRIAKATSTK